MFSQIKKIETWKIKTIPKHSENFLEEKVKDFLFFHYAHHVWPFKIKKKKLKKYNAMVHILTIKLLKQTLIINNDKYNYKL